MNFVGIIITMGVMIVGIEILIFGIKFIFPSILIFDILVNIIVYIFK